MSWSERFEEALEKGYTVTNVRLNIDVAGPDGAEGHVSLRGLDPEGAVAAVEKLAAKMKRAAEEAKKAAERDERQAKEREARKAELLERKATKQEASS